MVAWIKYPINIQGGDDSLQDCTIHSHQTILIPSTSKSRYSNKLLIFGGILNDNDDFDDLVCLEQFGIKLNLKLVNSQGNKPIGRRCHQISYLSQSI